MIVSPQEYNSFKQKLNDPNDYMRFFRIPDNEPIYEIDLSTRTINVPEFLSVVADHNAEIIWFMCDRFYDNIDLYDSTCWIQYVNTAGEEYFYNSPFLVGTEQFGNEKLLIPWAITNHVTQGSGTIEFSFQFFKLSEDHLKFLYVLNTLPAKGKILTGLRIDPLDFEGDEELTDKEQQLADDIHRLTERYEQLNREYELYWTQV